MNGIAQGSAGNGKRDNEGAGMMSKTPKNAMNWEVKSGSGTSKYILMGAIQLLAVPVQGSGWSKFKAQIVGLKTLKLTGEFDSVEAALEAAEKMAIKLITS